MTISRRLFTIGIIGLALSSAKAESRMTVNGIQYSTTSEKTVCAYLTVKAIDDVEIKEKIVIRGKEYKTTEVGKAFFSKNEYIQSLSIPNSVVKISAGAFKGCINLSKLVLPNKACSIDKNAFEGCVAIAYIATQDKKSNSDYILSYLPQNIPYYSVKKEFEMAMSEETIDEIIEDIELDVDKDIPITKTRNRNTFAFIIGNEEYTEAPHVQYAANDASVFAKYCEQTLGVPKDNIHCYTNTTFGKLLRVIRDMKTTAEAYKEKATIIFYYAGHGVPDEATKDAYLMPIDVDGKDIEGCYSLARLYKELGSLPVKRTYVFLDACFSGAQRGDGMLMAARGVALKVKTEQAQGNMVVMSAATGNETAYPYKEKKHGMFTYFLLNELNRSRGNCNIGELSEYIQTKVKQKSIQINKKSQTPTLSLSPNVMNDWKEMKLK